MPSPPSRKLPLRPVDYVAGPWPHGVLIDDIDVHGEETRYAVEQITRVVGDIIQRREQRGLRRSQLARMTGLRPNTISDLENGHSWPDLRTLSLIAWALDADLEFVPRSSYRLRLAAESPPHYPARD